MIRRVLLALLLASGPALPAFAAFSGSAAGTSSGQFLTVGGSARAAALGEAYSAVDDDAAAARYNPAALLLIEGGSLSFMHLADLQSAFLEHAAAARRFNPDSAGGLSLLYMNYGNIPQTDASGGSLGDAHPNDLAFAAAYARRLHFQGPLDFLDGGSVGLSAGYLQSRLVDAASAFVGSLGFLSSPCGPYEARLSLVAQNLGSGLKFDQVSDPLPLTLALGGSFHFQPKLLATAELSAPRDAGLYGALGVERWFGTAYEKGLALRAGLNTRTFGGGLGAFSGLSAGVGFAFSSLMLDYAFVPFGDLGFTHRLSLSLRFNGTQREKSEPPPEDDSQD